ncbi:hypothetical protein LCGC14_0375110 [marine sediment metagenome]|uniref:Uncharacterized protein n=1 Tax=marine sediment metagenome TaxID=412755 RepID=A0A0F9T9U6_9ZZZZ
MAAMKLDGKFHGVIVKNKDGSVVPQDQWMCFLAKDNAVPAMLETYRTECIRLGAGEHQIMAVDAMLERVNKWRLANSSKLKTPDIEPGEEIL